MISDANRTEFEQRGPDGVRGQIAAALYDAEKQKQAYKWLDEIEHEATRRSLIREQISIAADARDACMGGSACGTESEYQGYDCARDCQHLGVGCCCCGRSSSFLAAPLAFRHFGIAVLGP